MIRNSDLGPDAPTLAAIEKATMHDRTVTKTRVLRAIEDLGTTVDRLRKDAVTQVDRDLARESLGEAKRLVRELDRFVFDYHAILFEDSPEPTEEEG